MTIELNDLPTRLMELRHRLHAGEEVTLTDGGETVAKVVPQPPPPERPAAPQRLGFARGSVAWVAPLRALRPERQHAGVEPEPVVPEAGDVLEQLARTPCVQRAEAEGEDDHDDEHAPAQRLAQGVPGDDNDVTHAGSCSTTAR